jgi:hypothetical protein
MPSERVSMATLDTTSNRVASRRLSKAVTLLFRAGKQLEAASRTAPDKYHADHLRFIATGLRGVTLPLYRIASRLEKGGE